MHEFETESSISFRDSVIMELLFSVGDTNEDPMDVVIDEFRGPMLRSFVERALEIERDIHLGFASHRRGIPKEDSRNGYYTRDIELAVGVIEGLRVPRTRKGTFKTKLLRRYKRRQASVERLIRELFTRGISVRQVGEVLTPLLGIAPSHETVSRIAKELNEEVKKFKRRPLGDEYMYLMFDGITMKVKEAPGATKKVVLCAYGIKYDGKRELLSFQQERAESQGCWERMLNDLYRRGLEGKNLRLIVTDGGPGLLAALETVYPDVPKQRCWAHKLRNVSNHCRKRHEEECVSGARLIYLAQSRDKAIAAFKEWRARWQEVEPTAVGCLTRDLEELLTVFRLPEDHRKMMRTTNLLERVFREVRRRTNPMSCFTNAESCDRVIYAVFARINRHWQSRPIRAFTQKG